MKTIGIIAEYNPFHLGHLYQIEKIKELMSGDNIEVSIVENTDFELYDKISGKDYKTGILVNVRITNIILKIEENLDPVILTNILELKYLPLLGVGLNLDSCIRCGNKTDIVTIDASYGGLICKNCYQNELIVDKKVIQLIRMYYYVDIKSIGSINVKNEYKNTINKFISDYYDSFTGLYVYSKKFLEQLD